MYVPGCQKLPLPNMQCHAWTINLIIPHPTCVHAHRAHVQLPLDVAVCMHSHIP